MNAIRARAPAGTINEPAARKQGMCPRLIDELDPVDFVSGRAKTKLVFELLVVVFKVG
jgi:hypothetical protein